MITYVVLLTCVTIATKNYSAITQHIFSLATYQVLIYFFLASFSVARVSHVYEAKLNRVRRRSVAGGIQGNGEGGGSGRRESVVDESRKETADRVAKHQTDHVGRTCLCYSYHKLLQLPLRCFFCFASVFLSFPFALGRILFILLLYGFVLSVTSPGGARHLFVFIYLYIYTFSCLLCLLRSSPCHCIVFSAYCVAM